MTDVSPGRGSARSGHTRCKMIRVPDVAVVADECAVYWALGDVYRALSDVYQALGDVYQALGDVYQALGDVYQALGDVYQALSDVYRALSDVYRALGDVYWALGDVYQALGDVYQALGDVYRALGDVYWALGDVYRALGDVYQALGDVYQALGDVYQALGDVYQALGDVYRALGDVYRALSDVYRALGDVYRALSDVYQALGDVYQALGDVYQALGDVYQALGDVYQALGDVYQALGDVYQALGDVYRALEPYHHSYQTNLGNKFASQLEDLGMTDEVSDAGGRWGCRRRIRCSMSLGRDIKQVRYESCDTRLSWDVTRDVDFYEGIHKFPGTGEALLELVVGDCPRVETKSGYRFVPNFERRRREQDAEEVYLRSEKNIMHLSHPGTNTGLHSVKQQQGSGGVGSHGEATRVWGWSEGPRDHQHRRGPGSLQSWGSPRHYLTQRRGLPGGAAVCLPAGGTLPATPAE
nr:uncharacterized protein LOC123758051 [Procambarus clarkii]